MRPLLNDTCQDALAGLPYVEAGTYDTVKEHILNHCGTRHERLGDQFWSYTRPRGLSITQSLTQLQRILFRFAKNAPSRADVLDLILMEKTLQTLPPSAAAHVRDKKPRTAKEAAKLADYFFQDRRTMPDHPRWQKKSFQPKRQESGDSPREQDQNSVECQHSTRTEQSINPQKEKSVTLTSSGSTIEKKRGPKCYQCLEWGHIAARCPQKVLVVLNPKKHVDAFMVAGCIQGVRFEDLLIDSGADMTVIHSKAIPEGCYTGNHLPAQGFGQETTYCRTARIKLEVQDKQLELEVLVAPPNFLTNTALLGRDIPFLRDLLKDHSPIVKAVFTRAQKKAAKQQDLINQMDSDLSRVEPLSLDKVPDLEAEYHPQALADVSEDTTTAVTVPREEDTVQLLDPELSSLDEDLFMKPKKSPKQKTDRTEFTSSVSSMTDPFLTVDRDKLLQEQRKDGSLDTLWQEAMADDTTSHYMTEEGALLH